MNKKEIKRTAVRRRGTTIAAAALSIAMVGPFVHAVTPASPFAAVANAQDNQPAAEAPAAGGDKDKAIYSPGQADQKGTISGSVKEIVEAKVGFGNVQDSGKALKGVKIYAQWYEGENTQHSSPVYYTESDANGNFTIKMGPYTDALGKTRHFDADASAGLTTGDERGKRDQKREKIRVWTELPENMTDKYRLVHQPAAGIFPGIGANTTPTTQGDAKWGGNKITGMTIQYAQKDKLPQHLPENKWAESTGTGGNEGTYAGRAFWNLDVLQGALNHNTVSAFGGKDVPAAGMKVVGSYLTDDAVNKIEAYAKDNFAGKTLRGKGWTPADEAGLQKWINEQVAANPEGWIAETVTTTTGANGRFALKWKGIYGNSHNSRGIVPADKAGKLAGSPGEGRWTNGALDSKHVNMHWSYVSILGKDGKPLPDNIGALYPWALGQWAGPGFGADLNAGANAQLFGGDGALIGNTTDSYTGWNIALAPQALKFDVVDKNTSDNWAALGDKVQTDTAGLPIADNLNYYIEWVDKNGKVVKTCETAKADSATKIPSCELEVPADAQTGDTFTARLKVTPNNPDPKNDLVLAMDAFAVARDYLEYEPVDAKADEKATSEPKFDNPETEPEETKPEKAKFELGKLPEGVTEDQVEVDPATGAVTFTPTAAQVGKTFDFPVVMRDEALQVPVLDENGDPVKDEEGNAKTQGRIVARADATFNLADATANTVEPKYEDKLVVPGEETKSSPTFTDKDGKDVEVPADSKFTISEDFKAPEGYEVNIDKNTGEITVTVDGDELDKDTVEEFDVPVTVTYPDGSTDKTDANFKLDTDNDGKPDTEDEDDDNDGIPDEEDSNPKVPNQNTEFEPGYEDGSGK
ncbi:YPDG domain-containing protein, partial [Corynebacterium sp. HMSC072A04]|uniref:YPDG domain-containing protein n=1 Tax=Corynebacterium sp. HMSC072A04 TaxID=1715045 RepID=UPI000A8E37C8